MADLARISPEWLPMPSPVPMLQPRGIGIIGCMIRLLRGSRAEPRRARVLHGFGANRRLILAAILLGLALGAIAYACSDDLSGLVQSALGGKLGRAQGRLHY